MKSKNVFGLASTHTLKYVLIASLILCVAQFGLILTFDTLSLDMWIDHPLMKYSFLVFFIFISLICSATTKASLSKLTLNRLGISHKRMFIDFMLNVAVSLIILWCFQILSLMIISQYFVNTNSSEIINQQTIYLSVFRSDFFHMILPIRDFTLGFCSLSFIFMTSTLIARYILAYEFDGCISYVIISSIVHIGNNGVDLIVIGILYLVIGIYQLYKGVTCNEE